MAKKEKYRLQPILDLKERMRRASEIALAKAIKELAEEKKKLTELEEKKKKIKQDAIDMRNRHAEKVVMGESKIRDNELFFNYLRKLKEDEEEIDQKIENQKDRINFAEEKLRRARRAYIQACNELKMMEKHKELWEKKIRKALSDKENKELSELGNVVHQLNQRAK